MPREDLILNFNQVKKTSAYANPAQAMAAPLDAFVEVVAVPEWVELSGLVVEHQHSTLLEKECRCSGASLLVGIAVQRGCLGRALLNLHGSEKKRLEPGYPRLTGSDST